MVLRISIILLCLLASRFVAAQVATDDVYVGEVIAVTDGDTVKVLVGTDTLTIRLEGIDAPEKSQAFGSKSKQALSDLIFKKTVKVQKTGDDRYGRVLGYIFLDDVNINQKMLADGWSWHFKKYNKDEKLAQLEVTAREKKLGLWADANALAPWEFRARQQKDKIPADQEVSYWLNTKSNVRHNSTCEYFKNTSAGRECTAADGKPCGKCGG